LGLKTQPRLIEKAIKEAKVRTKDMGGTATTSGMGDAIVKKITGK